MKIINVEQGTTEWLSWRKTVITATDCPAIMGSSPWTSPYQCYQKKLGLLEEPKVNEAMERGKRLEPEARNQFIERYGIKMVPAVVESDDYDFLGASLDGISECGTHILEVKCGGQKLFDMASSGVIPQYYIDQMQHQLLVTGAKKCSYYVYNGSEGICIQVLPDTEFTKTWLSKARSFWKGVAFNEPPALRESDYKDMSGNDDLRQLAAMYREADAMIKSLEEKKDMFKKKMIEICDDQNCRGDGFKIMKVTTKGRISYDDIPELKGVNLESYRKSHSYSWRISMDEQ